MFGLVSNRFSVCHHFGGGLTWPLYYPPFPHYEDWSISGLVQHLVVWYASPVIAIFGLPFTDNVPSTPCLLTHRLSRMLVLIYRPCSVKTALQCHANHFVCMHMYIIVALGHVRSSGVDWACLLLALLL